MKCSKCSTENKDGLKICKKCSTPLIQVNLWKPSWKWHVSALVIIFSILLVAFFTLNVVLKPYMRQIPKDITPWLDKLPKAEKK